MFLPPPSCTFSSQCYHGLSLCLWILRICRWLTFTWGCVCARVPLISVINSTGVLRRRVVSPPPLFPDWNVLSSHSRVSSISLPWTILSATLITVNARAARFDWHREREKREIERGGGRGRKKKRKYNVQPEDSTSFAKYAGPASHQTVAGSFSLDSRPSSSRRASIPDYRKSITAGPLRTRSWKSSAVRVLFSKRESGETRRRGAIRDGRSHLNIVARRILFPPWTFEGNSTSLG